MENLWKAFLGILPTIAFAALVLLIGVIISKIIVAIMSKGLERGKIDKTAHGFLKSLVSIFLKTFVLVIVLSILGVPMASIIAVIGAAGLAIGLALKDSLSNLAGGFIILFAKPFKSGDYIDTNGISGTVESINILYTVITTIDNKTAFIPNGSVTNGKIVNYTNKQLRRLDMEFYISYRSDFEKAKSIIYDIVKKHPSGLDAPEPIFVRIGKLGEATVLIYSRVWVHKDKYWDMKYDILEAVKKEFDAQGIDIPINKLAVRLDETI